MGETESSELSVQLRNELTAGNVIILIVYFLTSFPKQKAKVASINLLFQLQPTCVLFHCFTCLFILFSLAFSCAGCVSIVFL